MVRKVWLHIDSKDEPTWEAAAEHAHRKTAFAYMSHVVLSILCYQEAQCMHPNMGGTVIASMGIA